RKKILTIALWSTFRWFPLTKLQFPAGSLNWTSLDLQRHATYSKRDRRKRCLNWGIKSIKWDKLSPSDKSESRNGSLSKEKKSPNWDIK
uniref:Uncharacterized protein n=1 Tax=Echinococcus canadensis TaxID=519352 RepID=A0A915EZK1_9CEST